MRLQLCFVVFLILLSPITFSQTTSGGLVINEILFNPPKDGFDYVEIYNTGDEPMDLQQIQIAKRNVTGDISGMKTLSRNSLLLKPGQYAVITSNEKWLKQQFVTGVDAVICEVASMPSFPDDEGSVLITGKDTSVIYDELHYSEKWQFPLLADVSGVALERININMETQNKNNWTSAASTVNFGTPGYQNSQISSSSPGKKEMVVEPALFSPDNDGFDDYAIIKLNLDEPGYLVNLTIYDLAGKRVKYLLKNEYTGASAQYRWDGIDDNWRALPQGIYLVVADIFNLKGNTKKFKQMITLARRK